MRMRHAYRGIYALQSAACAYTLNAVAGQASTEPIKKKIDTPKSAGELLANLATRQRHIFLSGSIDDELAKAVVAMLIYLDHESSEPISLHINSTGGKVYAAMAIYDTMAMLHSPVHTTCLGHCESMAAVILAAGEPGSRYALPNARIMIHQPVRGTSRAKSNARELAIQSAEIEKTRLRIAQLLANSTGRTQKELEELINEDHYCTAAEARELGIIDQIATSGHFSRTAASSKSDSSAANQNVKKGPQLIEPE